MNELKTLINKYLKLNNLKRSQLAIKLGYKNITGGLRKLDHFINNPSFDNPTKLKLQDALKIPKEDIDLAIAERLEYFETENKKKFKPFIQTIVSSRPSPIFVAAFVPQLWNISLNVDLQLLAHEDEIALIVNKYQQLQLEHAKNLPVNDYAELVAVLNDYDSNNTPYSWVFGQGFRYFRKYGETLVFNRECVLQKTSRTEQPSIAYVRI
ncbi:MAG: hypothetical protein JJV99_11325 [Colwellia sp.]|nr:hypothetical protein [Colwellia sp.]